jgi:homoserine O-succinyltransferase/O-acetyltransferase
MPLEIQPPLTARPAARDALVIGLINNMPDSALEGTESQFKALLSAAAGERQVLLRIASLPEVPRAPEARARIAQRYWTLEQLQAQAPDAIIVTGTEPKTAVLSDEPYWARLVELIDYADANLISSAWSCLAAHAAVLHLDGIARRRLAAKRFGVFDQRVLLEHALTGALGAQIRIPHSRWNDLPIEALAAAGYRVLTQSQLGDADFFIKQRRSLLVFFQGHPEYEERTLLKEYQRDVGRFISGEYREYPQAPPGYFSPDALSLIADFERRLRAGELAQPLAAFPFAALAASIDASWIASAAQIYGNWLAWIASRK